MEFSELQKKKVLIITYYWPPAGGPGVQRWLKFAKYLPDYDIHPVVYIPENPSYPLIDNTLIDEIPKDITVIKHPIKEPYRGAGFLSKKVTHTISSGVIPKENKQSCVQKLMLYIRGNYFIPDARKAWVKPSFKYLSEYLKNEHIDTVITTGPPHSLHLIGLQLKKGLGLNWIADFRDPWTTIGYHKKLKLNAGSKQKHEDLESKVLNTADHIIVTSEHTKREFAAKSSRSITVITNGYDHREVRKQPKDTSFSIAHIGSLLSERNPKNLWRSIGQLISKDSTFKDAFILRLVGVVSAEVLEEVYRYIPKENVDVVGYVSHKEAIDYQNRSQVLLLVEIDSEDTKAIIPGKLFEYMVADTPILAIGPVDSDVERIVKTTNTGRYFYYEDDADLKSYLSSCFTDFKDSQLKTHPIGLQPYHRKQLTRKLAQIIGGLS